MIASDTSPNEASGSELPTDVKMKIKMQKRVEVKCLACQGFPPAFEETAEYLTGSIRRVISSVQHIQI